MFKIKNGNVTKKAYIQKCTLDIKIFENIFLYSWCAEAV